VRTRNFDDWTIDRWRTEPRLRKLHFEANEPVDQTPPLWKDLTYASLIALLLWGMTAAVLV
jgi:hypothetical protein